jgi:hypothetical protein
MVDVDGRKTGTAGEAEHEPTRKEPVTDGGHICNVAFCPIGLALSAVQPMKPDVIEHLLLAGREFFLAAKAVLDARADELKDDGVAPTLEKIDIG